MNNFAYDVFIILFCSCAVFTIPNKGDVNDDDRTNDNEKTKREGNAALSEFLNYLIRNE